MAAKKQLSEENKRFIVISLAMYESPSEVMETVKEKYGVTLTRAGIQNYDPTKVAGRDLSEELKNLFIETRAEYKKRIADELPLMDKYFRVKKLSRYVENAENMGNEIGAAALIKQIAMEDGGMFTNRRELTGANGSDLSAPFTEVFNKFLNKAYGDDGDDQSENQ